MNRRPNLIANVFEAWIALAGIIGGSIYFYSPASLDSNSISRTLGFGLALVWNICYFLSGLTILYGLLRPAPRMEIIGLLMLGVATGVNGVSVFSYFGWRGAATAITFLTLTAAAWVRAAYVYRRTVYYSEVRSRVRVRA